MMTILNGTDLFIDNRGIVNMSEDLKPCRFCRSSLVRYVLVASVGKVECNQCGAQGSNCFDEDQDFDHVRDEAIKAWNTIQDDK